MKQWMTKLRAIPCAWTGAAVLVLALAAWWIKKISGLSGMGITVDYPAVPSMAVVMMLLSLIALGAALAYGLRAKNFCLHRMFLICGLLIGSLYLFIFPPLSVPDEWAHYVSAYKISNQLLGVEAVDENGHVMVQEEEKTADVEAFPDAGEYQYFWTNYFGRETGDKMVSSGKGANGAYALPYLPQALGITIARVLGFNFATRILFGRIVNLVWSVLAISVAIKWMPFGKKVLFAVAMLPMVLHELASNSYDAWIVAFSLMFIAYCMKLGYEKERVENRDVAMLAGLICLLAPCKLVYTPLIGLCLLIPREKFGQRRRWLISAAIVLGSVVLVMFLINGRIMGNYVEEGTTGNIIGWAGEEGYTITYFLNDPLAFPKIIWNTFTVSDMSFSKDYFHTMFGRVLGWLDPNLRMPTLYYQGLILLVFAHFVTVDGERRVFRKGNKLWMLALIAAVIVLVMTSMLLSYTPLSSPYIIGVQGRYFLPVLPLVALVAFKDTGLVVKKDYEKLLSALYAVFHAFLLVQMFGQVITVHLIAGS